MDKEAIILTTSEKTQRFIINTREYFMKLGDVALIKKAWETYEKVQKLSDELPAFSKEVEKDPDSVSITMAKKLIGLQLEIVDDIEATIELAFGEGSFTEIFGNAKPLEGMMQVFRGIVKALDFGTTSSLKR